METEQIVIGLVTFTAMPRGGGRHVDVQVRGAGAAGSRPLCGEVVMSVEEWQSLRAAADRAAPPRLDYRREVQGELVERCDERHRFGARCLRPAGHGGHHEWQLIGGPS